MGVRIPVITGLLLLTFIAPWWLTVVLTLLALVYFNNFYEAAAIGAIIDSVYGFTHAGFWGLSLPFTLIFFLAVIGAAIAKKKIFFPR